VLEKLEERRLCPLQIVENGDERSLGRRPLEQPPNPPGDLLGGGRRSALAEEHRHRPGRLVSGVSQLQDNLDGRPVGDSFPVRQAAPAHDERVEIPQELLDQPRLPDARHAEQREQDAGELGHGPLPRVPEQPQLALATDERHVEPPRRRLAADRVQPVRRHDVCLPFDPERRDLLGVDCIPDEPVRLEAEQDLARARRLLEPRGHVHRVARGEPLLRAGDHLARVDADSRLEPRAVVVLELFVQPCERLAHPGRRAHGAQPVVLVHDWNAEDGHDRVADELLDGAAVLLDHLEGRPQGLD